MSPPSSDAPTIVTGCGIIESLVQTATAIKRNNRALTRNASKTEINQLQQSLATA